MAKHTSKKPVKKSHVRPVKVARERSLGSDTAGSSPRSVKQEFSRWLSKWLLRTDRVAAAFCGDFLKSRRKDILASGVRARIRTKLEKYAAEVDGLRWHFRDVPAELRSHIAELEAAGGSSAWAAGKRVAECLDRIHAAIEQQRVRLAAPMSEEEEKQFWQATRHLVLLMQKISKTCKVVRKAIKETPEPEDPDFLKTVEFACDKLCDGISMFGRAMGTSPPPNSSERIQDVQDAATHYRQLLARVGEKIEQAKMAETFSYPTSKLVHLESEMGFQATILDAVLYSNTVAFQLPRKAFDEAQKIQRIVSQALRDSIILAAKAGLSMGDRLALCDSLPEEKLPEYSHLSPKPKEQEQYRAIVDALLLHFDACGPNATLSRKDLEKHVAALAAHRRVTGLGTTNVWNKLQPLVNKLKVVRQVRGVKTEANPNASDEFRLSLPAQSKYAGHAAAVRAEWAMIEALPASTDPAD